MAYSKFIKLHQEKNQKGSRKSIEWKILWKIIKEHEEGICDVYCNDVVEVESSFEGRKKSLSWLESKGYIVPSDDVTDAWENRPTLYRLDWEMVKKRLGIEPPVPLIPLLLKLSKIRNKNEINENEPDV